MTRRAGTTCKQVGQMSDCQPVSLSIRPFYTCFIPFRCQHNAGMRCIWRTSPQRDMAQKKWSSFEPRSQCDCCGAAVGQCQCQRRGNLCVRRQEWSEPFSYLQYWSGFARFVYFFFSLLPVIVDIAHFQLFLRKWIFSVPKFSHLSSQVYTRQKRRIKQIYSLKLM